MKYFLHNYLRLDGIGALSKLLKRSFYSLFPLLDPLPRPENKKEIIFHYFRHDQDYDQWNLWVWHPDESPEGVTIHHEKVTEAGLCFRIPEKLVSRFQGMGYIFKRGEWIEKDGSDRFLDLQNSDSLTDSPGGRSFFLLSDEETLFSEKPDFRLPITRAFLDSSKLLQIIFPRSIQDWELNEHFLKLRSSQGTTLAFDDYELVPQGADESRTVNFYLKNPISMRDKDLHNYEIISPSFSGRKIEFRGILFDPRHFYADKEMGLTRDSSGNHIFRVFAPTAARVSIRLFEKAEAGDFKDFPMREDITGIWEGKIPGKRGENRFYRYHITGSDLPGKSERVVMDPYSRCHTHHLGRSHIFHADSVDVAIAPSPVFHKSEAVIYETHIRDLTIHPDSGVKKKGKYLGFTEGRTSLPGKPIKTSVAHLKELGVNVIQLLPIHDFDNHEQEDDEYNWGYMPWFYFAPDGWYASNPKDLSRVTEFKQLINSLHKSGFKVVMDVVYNHTAESGPRQAHSLNGCVPGYYYRRRHDGSYFNGSGCGNEVKSEAPMMRKLIIDSLKYWVTEFKIDGFRFDLMGLMDFRTFTCLEEELTSLNPDILLYGEPWAGGQAGIEIMGKGFQKKRNASVFNDTYRNAIMGNPFDNSSGFLENGGNLYDIKNGLIGGIEEFAVEPLESINYFSCHDNRTLYDKILHGNPQIDPKQIKKMAKMAASLILTSQGIPFILGGEEILRTKQGIDNSYNSPDEINQIDWPSKLKNLDLFNYYRDLIKFRQQQPLMRMRTNAHVRECFTFLDEMFPTAMPGGTVAFMLENCLSFNNSLKRIICYFNPQSEKVAFEVPKGAWRIMMDNYKFKFSRKAQKKINKNSVLVDSYGVTILGEYPSVPRKPKEKSPAVREKRS